MVVPCTMYPLETLNQQNTSGLINTISNTVILLSTACGLSNYRARLSQEELGILPILFGIAPAHGRWTRDTYQPWSTWIDQLLGSSVAVWNLFWLVVPKNLRSSRCLWHGATNSNLSGPWMPLACGTVLGALGSGLGFLLPNFIVWTEYPPAYVMVIIKQPCGNIPSGNLR